MNHSGRAIHPRNGDEGNYDHENGVQKKEEDGEQV
jgi:hypothetical protein